MKDRRPLVIGIGNAYRGDDGIGLTAAKRLSEKGLGGVRIVEHDGEGTGLMESWKAADRVILIDAVSSGAAPGTLHRFDPLNEPLPRRFFQSSTHAFGVAEGVELARAMNRLPQRLVVYGIEGKSFKAGEGISPEVARRIDLLVEGMIQEIEQLGQGDA